MLNRNIVLATTVTVRASMSRKRRSDGRVLW